MHSLKDNNFFFLHSYQLAFDYAQKSEEKDLQESNVVRARFSLHIRTFLEMIGVSERDIYGDADE